MAKSRKPKWFTKNLNSAVPETLASAGSRAGGIVVAAVVTNKVVPMADFIPAQFGPAAPTVLGLVIETVFTNKHLKAFGAGMTDYGVIKLTESLLGGNSLAQKAGLVPGLEGIGRRSSSTSTAADQAALLEELSELSDGGSPAPSRGDGRNFSRQYEPAFSMVG